MRELRIIMVAFLAVVIQLSMPSSLLAQPSGGSDTQWEKIHPENIFVNKNHRKNPTLKFRFPGEKIGDTGTVHTRKIDFPKHKRPHLYYNVVTNDSADIVLVSNNWASTKGGRTRWIKAYNTKGELIQTFKGVQAFDMRLSPSGEFFTSKYTPEGTDQHHLYISNIKTGNTKSYPHMFYEKIVFKNTSAIFYRSKESDKWVTKFNSHGELLDCNSDATFIYTNCEKIRRRSKSNQLRSSD